MRHGVARIARALRVACDTPAFRGASPGCSVRRTQDGGAHGGEVVKDSAVGRLLLERAIQALDDPVGFRLFEEAEAGVDAPVADLVEEVV